MKMIKAVIFSVVTVFASSLYASQVLAGEVSINKADAPTLAAELSGVGQKKAKAIVEYRELNGAFKTIDELQKVKGISIKTLEKNKGNITL